MRTAILLDGGRLAYLTSHELSEQELDAIRGPGGPGGGHLYAFQADELIDHRTPGDRGTQESRDKAIPAAAWAKARDEQRDLTPDEYRSWVDSLREDALGYAARPLTIGGEVEIITALEERWDRARRAYGLPDDGITAWSLTLRETEGGWEAEAWRSDTTTTNAVGSTAGAALEALASRAGPHDRRDQEERRRGKAYAIAAVRTVFQGRTEPVTMTELEEYLEAVEVQLGLEPEQP